MFHTPPHVPKERMLCTSSVQVLLALWRLAKTVNFMQTMIYGGDVHACTETTASLVQYTVPIPNLPGLDMPLTCGYSTVSG